MNAEGLPEYQDWSPRESGRSLSLFLTADATVNLHWKRLDFPAPASPGASRPHATDHTQSPLVGKKPFKLAAKLFEIFRHIGNLIYGRRVSANCFNLSRYGSSVSRPTR